MKPERIAELKNYVGLQLADFRDGELADLLATAEREAKLREALRSCLSCMEIQEHREDESFHLSVEAFRPMWDEAKANAMAALEQKGGKHD